VKILAVDTATENCSAALLIDGRLTHREEQLARGAAERILPMVQELLEGAGIGLKELDAIAFGRGPGGFTGVRLAASITQGLAFGAGVPVVPVSDLEALAQRALDLPGAMACALVCSDARMQEVYWACFERDEAGAARRVGAEQVGRPEAVQLPGTWHGPAVVTGAGSGFAAYPQLSARLAPSLGVIHPDLLPRAAEIAQLAVTQVIAGHMLPAEQAIPVYLRDNVAQPPKSLN
jgi:tRNA threonylcarbamoyladenosine biosynthesis protein TsaB